MNRRVPLHEHLQSRRLKEHGLIPTEELRRRDIPVALCIQRIRSAGKNVPPTETIDLTDALNRLSRYLSANGMLF